MQNFSAGGNHVIPSPFRAHMRKPRAPQRLLIVLLRRRNARDQQRQRVAANRVFEQFRELRVAIVDVRLRGGGGQSRLLLRGFDALQIGCGGETKTLTYFLVWPHARENSS